MITRRKLLVTSAASGALAVTAADYIPKRKYRAAVIGHTGQGDYGHDWHTAWHGIANVEVTALADANEAGRRKAIQPADGAATIHPACKWVTGNNSITSSTRHHSPP